MFKDKPVGERLWALAIWALVIFFIVNVIATIAAVGVDSFGTRWFSSWLPAGFTTRWYATLMNDADMLAAAGNSLMIAALSSTAATLLGTMAGLAMHQYKLRLLPVLVLAPVAMPEILLGVSLLLFFRQVLDLTLGFWSILAAHITFSLGAVALIVQSRLVTMDESIFEAARDLGATPWKAFVRIRLPLIMPAVAAGFLVAFTLSIDDFVITFFNAGVGVKTLPLQIYSMIKVAVTPEVNAVSTVLMSLTLSLIAIASRFAPDALRGRLGEAAASKGKG